jgi:nucleoside-diphosphate-sugar epimerase
MAISTQLVASLAEAVTRRNVSVFDAALTDAQTDITATYSGARVLITGGAGFIGGQTLRLLLAAEPRLVVIADVWENGLAETVRQLRTSGAISPNTRIEPRLVDVTSPLVDRMIAEEGPFDVVLAFAAAKHVRSERDAVSALQLLNTNVLGTRRVLRAVAATNPDARLFMVSTDKAADPSSLMGASKRLMERAVFAEMPNTTTTRFANVAFSNGSLLESWLLRLANGQPLPVPRDTSRFFVQPVEAGQLCLLASVAPAGGIVVPAPGMVEDTPLTSALERVLSELDLKARFVDDEADLGSAADSGGVVTVLRTPRDTAGEKAAEVFVGADERADDWRPGLQVIDGAADRPDVNSTCRWIAAACDGKTAPGLSEILAEVARAVPEFGHVASAKRLDDRI